jgi:hypothetical protein
VRFVSYAVGPAAWIAALALLAATCTSSQLETEPVATEAAPEADPCDEARAFLERTLEGVRGRTPEARRDSVTEGRGRARESARRAAIVIEQEPNCFDISTKIEVIELATAADEAEAAETQAAREEEEEDASERSEPPEPEEGVAAAPAPTPAPAPAPRRRPQGELMLVSWGDQDQGGSSGGTACTRILMTWRNASDTPIDTVTVKFNSSWGWLQSSDDADDGIARSFFEDGTPVFDSRTLGVGAYSETTFRWRICTPDQYGTIYPGWKGQPFGFSAHPLSWEWRWAG